MSILLTEFARRETLVMLGAALVTAACTPGSQDTADSGAASADATKLANPITLATIRGGFPGGVTTYRDASGYHRALAISTPARNASNIGNALYSVPLTGGEATDTTNSALAEPANLGDPLALDMGGEVTTANNGIVFRGPGEATGRFIPFPSSTETGGLEINTGMGVVETDEGIWVATANMKNTSVQNSGYHEGTVLFYPVDADGNILEDEWNFIELPGVNPTSVGKTSDGRVVVLSAGSNFDSSTQPYVTIIDPKSGDAVEIGLTDLLGFDFVGQFSGKLAVGTDSRGEYVAFGTTKSSTNPSEPARVIKLYLDLSDQQVAELASGTITGVDLLSGGLLVAGFSDTGEVIAFRADSLDETSRVVVVEDGTDEQVGRLVASAYGVVVNVNGRTKDSRVVLVGVG